MKEKHWQDLKGSGISDEIITLNFRSVEGDAIYEDLTIGCTARRNDGRLPDSWLKLYSHCTEGGWWSNGISLVDFQEIEWGCFKPDKPRLDTTKEKPKEIKYEHPKGVPTDIFVLKVGKAACTLINELWEANLEPDTFWQGVIDNKDLPVFITEGAKKAACLLSNGFIAIALPGIWNGCKKEGEGHVLHPSLVPLVGRTFFIAFDHDTKPETKRQVTGAANRLKKVLEALDSPCYSLAWIPAFKGCDDLIVEKGADYFRAVVDKALKKTEVITSTPLKEPQGWDDKEGKPTVETSTPLTEPRKETARIYGGSKDLKTHELVEFVQNYIARDLELDDLRSEILLEGKRLSLGSDCKVWFYRKYGETAGKEDIYDVLLNFAKERRFNPVKRYLEKVAKQPKRVRIDDLATRYFGRSEKIYNRMVEMWLISAIARALDKGTEDNPGCQVDHTLILQSGQGKYKSTFFKVLGGAWFDDSVADIDSKDSLMIVHSSWIIELSELDRITSKKQAGSIKHWLTKKTDSYRKPYAKEIDPQLPRPCVFCGTVNPTRFLMDDENRRFWVISVSEELDAIDIPMITRERDAIWASAYYAYHLGGIIPLLTLLFQAQIQESPLWTLLLLMEPKQPWWPTASEAALIAAIGEQCKELDAWQDEIENWIKDRLYISSYQILTELLHIEPGNIKRGEDMRVMKILNSLGWVKETRKDIPDLDNGGIKKRRVRLNPDARFLDLDGKDGKVGKSLDIEASQDYQPHKKDGKRLVEEETTNLPTSKTGITDPQTQTGQAIYQPSQPTREVPKTSAHWQEKNGHKLTEGMWISTYKQAVLRLITPNPAGKGWLAEPENGPQIQISDQEIALVWEV